MAATVSSVWSKPGAWALDSEQHEDELNQQHQLDLSAPTKKPDPPAADFPSLSAAVTTKPKKKSKQVLSLAEFSNYKPPSAATAAADVVLPTGPRERTAEEIAESRRGGFRSYGDRGGDRSERPRAREGFEGGRDMGPSRADEIDDWSKTKKFSSFGPGPERGDRERDMGPSRADEVDDWSRGKKFGSGFGAERGGGGGERREKVGFFNSSRADEVDNWGANKGFGAAAMVDDRRRERRVGFEATGPGSDVDNWVRNKEGGGGSERPRLNLKPRTLPVATNEGNGNGNGNVSGDSTPVAEGGKAKGNPFGAARPREEVLKEKGMDWKEIDEKLEASSVKENGNGNGNVSGGEVVVGPVEPVKPKGNPFGAARPREEVLKEKGEDWKEIDEKLEAVKIKEVEKSSAEGFGRRRAYGLGSGEEKSVGAWRKPAPWSAAARTDAAAATPTPTSVETTEKIAESVESTEKAPSTESTENVPEEN